MRAKAMTTARNTERKDMDNLYRARSIPEVLCGVDCNVKLKGAPHFSESSGNREESDATRHGGRTR